MTAFGQVYGEGLFDLASEEGIDKQVLSELRIISSILSEEHDYVRLMMNQSIPAAERAGLLQDAFAGRCHQYVLNFLKLISDRNAFDQFPQCLSAYEKRYHEKHNIELVTVTTAIELTELQKERLTAALHERTGKEILLKEIVDPSVRGGIRCEMSGYTLDNTILTKLATLRRSLSSAY